MSAPQHSSAVPHVVPHPPYAEYVPRGLTELKSARESLSAGSTVSGGTRSSAGSGGAWPFEDEPLGDDMPADHQLLSRTYDSSHIKYLFGTRFGYEGEDDAASMAERQGAGRSARARPSSAVAPRRAASLTPRPQHHRSGASLSGDSLAHHDAGLSARPRRPSNGAPVQRSEDRARAFSSASRHPIGGKGSNTQDMPMAGMCSGPGGGFTSFDADIPGEAGFMDSHWAKILSPSRTPHRMTPVGDTPRGRFARSPASWCTDHRGVASHDVCGTYYDTVASLMAHY